MMRYLCRISFVLMGLVLIASEASGQWLVPPPRQAQEGPFAFLHRSYGRRGLPPLRLAAERPSRVPNQIVVKYRGPKTMERKLSGVSALSLQAPRELVHTIPQLDIAVFRVPDVDAAMEQLRQDPDVVWVAPRLYRYPLISPPNDPAYNQLDYLLPGDPETATYYKWDSHMIYCVEGWSQWPGRYYSMTSPKGTDAVTLAVIDTGIDYTHPDFINAGGTGTDVSQGGQLLTTKDASIFNGVITPGASDDHGHGTHVAGIAAAATNNGIGTVGTGFNANIISIKCVDANGDGTDTDIAQAIVYAVDQGAQVINLSLGSYEYSPAEQDAVNYAWRKNVLVVAAAGNDGADKPNYPGALSKVLTVAATSRISAATYSNFGPFVGICAPGGDFDFELMWLLGVYSTMPTYYVTLNDPNQYGAAQNYDYLMGTSMASPHVAGLAALYMGSKRFTRSTPNAHLRTWQALQRSASGSGGWSPNFGWGQIDVEMIMYQDLVPNPREDTVGCVTGQVRFRGTPVQNASVTARLVGTSTQFTAASRADGNFRLTNIPAGTYNISATYFGETQRYSNVVVEAACDTPGIDFNVGAFPCAITVDNVAGDPGTSVVLSAVMQRTDNGEYVEDARLWFSVAGTELGYGLTDEYGRATFDYFIPGDASPGDRTITVRYYGDGAFADCSGTGTLTVRSGTFPTWTEVPDRSGITMQSVALMGYLRKQSDNSPVPNKNIAFSIDGTPVGSAMTNSGGLAAFDWVIAEGPATRTIGASFAGDSHAEPSSGSGTLTVSKADTTLTLNGVTGTAGGSVEFTGNLRSNPPVVGRSVTIRLNGTELGSVVTDSAGNYSLPWSIPADMAVGDYPLEAAFAGDDNYNPSSATANLTVKSSTTVTVTPATGRPGQLIMLNAALSADNTGDPLAGRPLDFYVDGTFVGSGGTNSIGRAATSYRVIDGATARTITASFTGEALYNPSQGEAGLTVTPAATTLWTINRTGRIYDNIYLRQYDLKRTTDNALLQGKTIVFRVDGTQVGTAVTDDSGDASFLWLITEGPATRTITVEFPGDINYTGSSASATLTAEPPLGTKMVGFDRTVRIGGRTELRARLLDMNNQPLVGQTIHFSVDGTYVIARPTDSLGDARYPFYDVPDAGGAGNRTILSEFRGGSGYAPISRTATLTVIKALPYIWIAPRSIPQGETYRLYCYFRRLYDYKPQEGKTLAFSIDGTWIADVVTGSGSSDRGVARYNYPTSGLSVGVHVVRCDFAGDPWVDAGYGEATLTIY